MASSAQPSVHVRAAIRSDVARILQIEREAQTAAHWAECDYETALAAPTPRRWLFVAEIDAQVQGFFVARASHPSEWEIENVAVAEPVRKLGIGAAMLNAFLEQIRSQKPSGEVLIVHLEVRESNLAARRLYEKAGFLLDKRRPAYYRNPEEDALLYHLIYQ